MRALVTGGNHTWLARFVQSSTTSGTFVAYNILNLNLLV